ncbi:MAG: isocitrate lyase/PEP mutase family protein [Castellaniella sp.]
MNTPSLKDRLAAGKLIVAPGIFDFISLKLAERAGFDCLYMTGYGTVASYLGLPDAGLATYTDMLNRVTGFCGATRLPVICDGDTGYGGLLNVAHAVDGYIRAGAAAIQIEDQEFPKKCGHTRDRRVIPAADMVTKIRVACEARGDRQDFLIIARTDARSALGLDEALRRGEQYAAAGADLLFIESPESRAELETIARRFALPLIVNVVEGGRTPLLSHAELEQMGFAVAIYPTLGFLAMGKALEQAYAGLKARGDTLDQTDALMDFSAFSRLIGFERVWDFEQRWRQGKL